ncbi:MAG: hypothetical protein K8E66_06810 [Phycisphaerales bacterium]|nr:hypothetical protein [Phycisphaerales bacterium]
MRTVLIALVVGFVGPGVAVAIGPPGDPEPGVCVFAVTLERQSILFDCNAPQPPYEGTWVHFNAPHGFSRHCVSGECTVDYVEGPPTVAHLEVPAYPTPGVWVATFEFDMYYTSLDGTLEYCDGNETDECCTGESDDLGVELKGYGFVLCSG